MAIRLLLLGALSLLVVACGADDEADVADDPDAEEPDEEAAEPGEDWPDELVLTLTPSQDAQALIDDAEPLGEALEEALGVDVDAQVPTDFAGVIVALGVDEADVSGGLGPVQMVQAEADAGADLILQSERDGEFSYVAQWFTNDPDTYCDDDPVDVPYETDDGEEHTMLYCNGVDEVLGNPDEGPVGADALANAEGRTVSYVDEGSTSGFVFPALQLIEHDIDPIDDVEPVFAGGHDSSVLAVYEGDAEIGVSYNAHNDARRDQLDVIPDVGEETVVFAWSNSIPNDGFAVNGRLPEDLKDAVNEALLDFAASEEGQQTLNDLYDIDGLAEVDSADFDPIREALDELDDLIED